MHVFLGAGCSIYDTDFHSVHHEERINRNSGVKTAPVTIGSRVFVGAHAIILKGVTIGDDAVIGAGAVVAKSVPAGEIWAGNPIRLICLTEMLGHLKGLSTTTVASSDIGRVLQLMKAAERGPTALLDAVSEQGES